MDREAIIDSIIEKNRLDENFNCLKLAEECTELAEICLKTVTKHEGRKPDPKLLIEEMGDVMLRIAILGKDKGILNQIEYRIDDKLEYIVSYPDRYDKNI